VEESGENHLHVAQIVICKLACYIISVKFRGNESMHDITIGVLMLCDIHSVNYIWFLRTVPKFLTKNILDKIVICATQTC
jgi:hypothetical protein